MEHTFFQIVFDICEGLGFAADPPDPLDSPDRASSNAARIPLATRAGRQDEGSLTKLLQVSGDKLRNLCAMNFKEQCCPVEPSKCSKTSRCGNVTSA